jgi:hypothetical protein
VNHRAHHLSDEQLLDCYLAERDGSAPDPRVAEHLSDCAECGAGLNSLSQFMDALRSDADADTDHMFPVEWLRQQQQQIAGRLEQLGRLGRVISFPVRHADGVRRATSRVGPRWVAAAAAAGLFIGVALGHYYDLTRQQTVEVASAPTASGQTPPAVSLAATASEPAAVQPGMDDDAFLAELELAVDGLHARELMPFYAFTPTVLEASTSLR